MDQPKIRVFVRTFLAAFVLATTSWDVAAQSAICDIVRPGDTAAAVARRLTGRADSRHQPWFRIIDRARLRVIPRARYDRILAGWQVCVPAARFTPQLSAAHWGPAIRRIDTTMPSAAPSAAFRGAPQWIVPQRPQRGEPVSRNRALEIGFLCLVPAVFGGAIGFGWQGMDRILSKRRAVKREMLGFGEVFVRDFERPLLIAGDLASPLRARLRCAPRTQRLEVLLAPGAGRRYPNLDDHRRNVEYDVDRICRRLRHHPFVLKPIRAQGQWVVIPFQFKPGLKTGAVV